MLILRPLCLRRLGRLGAFLSLLLLGGTVPAFAQFTFWTGGNGTTTWNDPANWDNGTPTLTYDTLIDTNSAPMPVLVGVTGSTSSLTVGAFPGANATLTVLDGAVLTSNSSGTIGGQSGAIGAVTVNNATWTLASGIDVGSFGQGNLSVLAGGAVNVGDQLRLGADTAATGTMLISGVGSVVNVTNNTIIADSGFGNLTIENGGSLMLGQVSSSLIDQIGNAAGSNGTVLVTGANSTWTDLNDFLNVGGSGNGSLSILNGANVTATGVTIGFDTTSNGTLLISGNSANANSTFTVHSYLGVGEFGTGNLTVKDGGILDTSDTYQVSIGSFLNAQGNVTISNATWNGGTTGTLLTVGDDGHGNLSIENGGVVTVASASIASCNCGDGEAEVTGNGSSLNITEGAFIIGEVAAGNLSITNNGSVTAKEVRIGDIEAEGVGNVVVDGLHSLFTVNGNFAVGNDGNATLTVSGGALLNSITGGNATLGNGPHSSGIVLITGTNSTWTNQGDLYVGNQGVGNLDVEDGGTLTVTSGRIILGADDMAVSNLTICDNSTLNIGGTNGLQTQGGNYTFTLEGGTVNVQTLDLTTALNVTLVASTVSTINTNALNATFSNVLSGGGDLMKAGAGTLTVAGANTYTGNTTVAGGKLQVNGTMASSSFSILAGSKLAVGASNLLPATARVTVAAGGNVDLSSFNQTLGNVTNNGFITGTGLLTIGSNFVLAGNGTITANVSLAVGAHVAPGNSIGTLSAANLTWGGSTDTSATAFFQLSNTDSTSDKIVLTGDLFKGAGTTFKFDFGNTGLGTNGSPTVYTLLSYGGLTDFVTGDFTYGNLTSGYTGTFDLSGNNLYFTVVPEPATWGLLLGVTGLFAALRRKRK